MENVKEIERLVKEASVVVVGGKAYSASDLKVVFDDRCVTPVKLNTLSGLVEFLGTNIDGLDIPNLICVVNSPDNVAVFTRINDETKRRGNVVSVSLMESGNKFNFGQFLDYEDFVIKLKALFVESADQVKLLNFCSRLTIQNEVATQDDGVSQSATLRKGISGAIKTNEVAPVTVHLVPYRTFHEVIQPGSGFLFRMRTDHNQKPQCALFEADGGAWKMKAMNNIHIYLVDNVTGLTVIA